MTAIAWIKQSEAAGWRVAGVAGLVLVLRCAKTGCTGSLKLPLDNLGAVPDPCTRPHVNGYAVAVYDDYKALVGQLSKRRRALGLSQEALNAAIGLPDGYMSKLEAFHRTTSPPTLLLWAQSLGLSLSLSPAPLPNATIRAIEQTTVKPYAASQARSKTA